MWDTYLKKLKCQKITDLKKSMKITVMIKDVMCKQCLNIIPETSINITTWPYSLIECTVKYCYDLKIGQQCL